MVPISQSWPQLLRQLFKEVVNESLLGTEEPTLLKTETRLAFLLHAKRTVTQRILSSGDDRITATICLLATIVLR